ncbi:VTT domain-containing protein [Pseudonocardia nematodicida]|uniref:VTT domain-containing protein n=1 Tax=Pseudonocardia nematodicida TaxID=1206997 RepID=A0ABV1K4V7_9PSEU
MPGIPMSPVTAAVAGGVPSLVDDVLGLVIAPAPSAVGWALALLAVGVVLEGPVVTVVAGSLAGAGLLSWWAVWLVAVIADVVSDTVFYLLGRSGRDSRVAPLLVRLGLTDRRREKVSVAVQDNLPRVVLGAKLVDIGAIPAFLTIGLAGVQYRRFLAWVVPVSAVRGAVLVGFGWLVGGRFAAELADRPWIIVAAGLAAGLVLVAGRALYVRARAPRKENVCAS